MAASRTSIGLGAASAAALAVVLVVILDGGGGSDAEPGQMLGEERAHGVEESETGPEPASATSALDGRTVGISARQEESAPAATSEAYEPWRPTLKEVLEILPDHFQVRPEQRASTLRSRRFRPLISIDNLEGAREHFGPDLDQAQLVILVGEAMPFDDELARLGERYCDELDYSKRDILARGAYETLEHEVGETPETGRPVTQAVSFPGYLFTYELSGEEYPALREVLVQADDVRERRLRHLHTVLDSL